MPYNSPFYVLLRSGTALPLLIFQLIVLTTFIYFREYRLKTCFRLMFSLGICHSLQLFIHFIVPLSRLVAENGLGEFVERLFGAILNISWDFVFLLDLLLAIERLIIVVRATIFYSTNDQEPIAERIIFNVLMALGWLLFLAITILLMTPCCGYTLRLSNYIFSYNFDKFPWNMKIRMMEYTYYLIMQPITFLCYLAIILLLVKEKISRYGSMQNRSNDLRTLINKREMRILFQSGVLFILSNTPVLLSLVFNQSDSLEFYLVFLWSIINGINPILYLIFNSDIRQNFLKMIGIFGRKVLQKSQTNTQGSAVIIVAPASSQNVL